MLHRFYVSNFSSIREEAELNFRIPRTTPDLSRFRKSQAKPRVRLPCVVALYGPNASGKSTVLRAIESTFEFITDSFANPPGKGKTEFPAFNIREKLVEPTRIEVEFETELFSPDLKSASICRYILELNRNKDSDQQSPSVGYEALFLLPKGRPKKVFERHEKERVDIAKEFKTNLVNSQYPIIPPNASVISTLARVEIEPFLSLVKWIDKFDSNLLTSDSWNSSDKWITRIYSDTPGFTEKISDFLPRIDVGIENMECFKHRNELDLRYNHRGLEKPVNFVDESSGTRNLIRMFPLIHRALESGNMVLLDNFDSELHPDLAAEIIRWFQSEEHNPRNAQLICSAHNTALLDSLEKEEVFITEKSTEGSTRVYGVRNIIGVPRTENLQNLYRSGVLGGLPNLG